MRFKTDLSNSSQCVILLILVRITNKNAVEESILLIETNLSRWPKMVRIGFQVGNIKKYILHLIHRSSVTYFTYFSVTFSTVTELKDTVLMDSSKKPN